MRVPTTRRRATKAGLAAARAAVWALRRSRTRKSHRGILLTFSLRFTSRPPPQPRFCHLSRKGRAPRPSGPAPGITSGLASGRTPGGCPAKTAPSLSHPPGPPDPRAAPRDRAVPRSVPTRPRRPQRALTLHHLLLPLSAPGRHIASPPTAPFRQPPQRRSQPIRTQSRRPSDSQSSPQV